MILRYSQESPEPDLGSRSAEVFRQYGGGRFSEILDSGFGTWTQSVEVGHWILASKWTQINLIEIVEPKRARESSAENFVKSSNKKINNLVLKHMENEDLIHDSFV